MTRTGYLAAEGFETQLEAELGPVAERHGRLLITEAEPVKSIWAQNIWHNPVNIEIESIKQAAAQLKAIQRNWALYDFQLHGRARLIQEQLPHVSAKPVIFPSPLPAAPLGSWTLTDANHILASANCSSPYKNGAVEFVEDKETPPNRAYLKLWEFFTVTGIRPDPGALCLDLGACPGGWSWVLAKFGCNVISIDKSPLAPNIASMPNIKFQQGSVFALEPEKHEPVDWLFSDVACYPARLLSLVQRWMKAGKARNFCCTIKLQGETDHEAVQAFAAIPGSHVMHLYHNKHELTWYKLA